MTRGAGEKARAARLPGLESRLFDIPEDKFIEVVRLLERVRDHPDVRQTFAAIRPRLVQVRPERRPTLKRVLCMPFEDVLESFGGVDVPLGRIERRVIDPVWKLVMECGDTALMDQLDRQVQETAPGNLNALRNIGRRLWPMAAQAIRVVVEQDGARHALWRVLHGDEDLQRQVLDVAAFLEIGLTVETAVLFVPALAAVIHAATLPAGSALGQGGLVPWLLAGSGVVTAVPLLLFAVAARKLDLSTLGFAQFIAPTILFVLGAMLYGEPLDPARVTCFVLIWAAIGLFSYDLLRRR